MIDSSSVEKKVHDYYWIDDLNCATVMLKILSERFNMPLHQQVLDSSTGMNGAGKSGIQCGLLEGLLMFIGIVAQSKGFYKEDIENFCRDCAQQFEEKYDHFLCRDLRPQGFYPDNPPHLCERLTGDAVKFSIDFLSAII